MRARLLLAALGLALALAAPASASSPLPDPLALTPRLPSHPSRAGLGTCAPGALSTCLPAAFGRAEGAAAPPAGAAGDWSVLDTPAPRTDLGAFVTGTACASATDCWAVGWSSNGSSTVALAEHWDGRSWTPVDTPAPPRAFLIVYGLNGVTCVAADECWAVGGYYDSAASYHPLVERWDGRSWSLVDAPATGGVDEPFDVTCTSASDCWMVGDSFLLQDCPATGCGWYTLIEHWDGQAWSRVESPNTFLGGTAAAPSNILRSVTCRSPTDCWAAGYTYDGDAYHALLARWDGSRWAAAPAPSAPGGEALLGVACASASTCWAVGLSLAPGANVPRPLSERWDGTAWTIADAPGGVGELAAIDCAGAGSCVAAGYGVDPISGAYRTSIEEWDGGAWRSAASPSPASSQGTLLDAVSCPSPGACVAAGSYPNALGVWQPVAESREGGRWRTTLDEYAGDASAVFRSIACAPRDACWAVGYDTARYRPLVARWDGGRFSFGAAAADPSAFGEGLYGATCAAASDCWAVGYAVRSNGWRTLAQHWDGRRWQHVDTPPVPSPPTGPVEVEGLSVGQYLQGVACPSRTTCWALGATLTDGLVAHPLLERWDGHLWTIAAQPVADGYLAAATCTAADDCWAVGGASGQALVEHWDGVAWTIAPTPVTSATDDDGLEAVACRSRADCWAVGGRGDAGAPVRTLALHWNGTSWTRAPSANAPLGDGDLYGVACSAASGCWAVGASLDGQTHRRGLIERWDGRAWTTATAPGFGAQATGDTLIGVACVHDAPDCLAVGSWAEPGRLHPLAERYPPIPASAGVGRAARPGPKARSCRRARHRRRARRHRCATRRRRRARARPRSSAAAGAGRARRAATRRAARRSPSARARAGSG